MSQLAIELADWLRWNPVARAVLCAQQILRVSVSCKRSPGAIAKNIDRLCAAARFAPRASWIPAIEQRIHRLTQNLDTARLDWPRLIPNVERRRIGKAVVLKPRMSSREKGVLFVSFENQWARLAHHCNLKDFAASYTLVVAPSWSPPHDLVNCIFPQVYPQPIFCLISSPNDQEIFPRLSRRYQVVPLYASSWVNPTVYQPVPFHQKEIDILMLANFGNYKRHFLLFKALRGMPRSVRVVLFGQANGNRTAEVLRAEARSYGVEDRIDLQVNAPNRVVFDALPRAKISLILSRREGSCVAVVESMFANTPVGLLEDAEIGSRVYINQATGRLLKRHDLAAELMGFLGSAGDYSPRAWVEQRISCFHSTKILNETLKAHALAAGEVWTQDIAVHHWQPDPRLVFPEDKDRMLPGYEDIRARFGIDIGSA